MADDNTKQKREGTDAQVPQTQGAGEQQQPEGPKARFAVGSSGETIDHDPNKPAQNKSTSSTQRPPVAPGDQSFWKTMKQTAGKDGKDANFIAAGAKAVVETFKSAGTVLGGGQKLTDEAGKVIKGADDKAVFVDGLKTGWKEKSGVILGGAGIVAGFSMLINGLTKKDRSNGQDAEPEAKRSPGKIAAGLAVVGASLASIALATKGISTAKHQTHYQDLIKNQRAMVSKSGPSPAM